MSPSERASLWNKTNKERRREIVKKYDDTHRKEKAIKEAIRRLVKHETIKEKNRVRKIRDKDKFAYHESNRRAAKRNATVLWGNLFFISEAYALAKLRTTLTGILWQVDHKVPLSNSLVCGLHNEFNLAVIPKKLNCTKGNRYWDDMPEES